MSALMTWILSAVLAGAGPSLRLEPTLANLERWHQRYPRDAAVAVNLMLLKFALNQHDAAQKLLLALPQTHGGVDPSNLRTIDGLRQSASWPAVISKIRQKNPALTHSSFAYRIDESDLRPEGMAYSPQRSTLYVGSSKGKIVALDREGKARDFAKITSEYDNPIVLGIFVDQTRDLLWAIVDNPKSWSDPKLGGSTIQAFRLADGTPYHRINGPTFGALNDLIVADDGQIIATNSSDGSLWQAWLTDQSMTTFLPPGSIYEPNGITIDPQQRTIFVANWHDIYRVDRKSRAFLALRADAKTLVGNIDGLYCTGNALIAVQNGIHPGRVLRIDLDRRQRRVVKTHILAAYETEKPGMTTGALDGDTFLYFLNNQLFRFDEQNRPLPGHVPIPIEIRRVSIAAQP